MEDRVYESISKGVDIDLASSSELKPLVGRKFQTLKFAFAFYAVYVRAIGFDTRKQAMRKVDDVTTWSYLHTPDCPIEVKPFVGRNFPTLEKAIQFYENYGRRVGFDTIKCGSKKFFNSPYGFIWCVLEKVKKECKTSKLNADVNPRNVDVMLGVAFKFDSDRGYVINNLNEEHNHPMVLPNHQKFMRLNRVLDDVHQKFIIDCAGVNIGPSLTFKLLTELMGGYELVGCTVLDVGNYTRDIRRYAEGHDAQMILDELRKKKESCDAFTYEYKVDSSDIMSHLFWCDPLSKENFLLFGDIVSFDTTYSTNSESVNSFSWLFRQFVKCMGVAQKLIITDQDLRMKVVVEEVLVNTRHRWCMWHIMAKVAEKVPKLLLGNADFKELNSCVWSELIEPTEFEDTWHKIMEEYGLEDTDWFSTMFRSRQYWVPWPIEKYASTIFADSAFKEIQDQILEAYNHCKLDSTFHCGCKMFLRTGLVCCHIFLVLKHKNIKLIPYNLIGGRWLKSPLVKSARGVDCEDVITHVYVDEKKKKASFILLGEILSLYQAVSVDIDQTPPMN
ncbi:protein FAR1-RELATED SEQUENCE 5-like [Salvia splendens]|uniref:protein FAR1-RELATED SEQUENCE 5-like n=1 Tax=Salvia splendens TaxID=180675 RepID=UPI001C265A71|nr:protein FAR1-RELATED SEQUENCE 5-like [Salvia splendens]